MSSTIKNTKLAIRKFNDVFDDLFAHFDNLPFDRTQRISSAKPIGEPVWYCANRDVKIAYLPPESHHKGVPVPSIHVRVYRQSLITPVQRVYLRHGLKPEVFDHELFGKYDIDAELR